MFVDGDFYADSGDDDHFIQNDSFDGQNLKIRTGAHHILLSYGKNHFSQQQYNIFQKEYLTFLPTI